MSKHRVAVKWDEQDFEQALDQLEDAIRQDNFDQVQQARQQLLSMYKERAIPDASMVIPLVPKRATTLTFLPYITEQYPSDQGTEDKEFPDQQHAIQWLEQNKDLIEDAWLDGAKLFENNQYINEADRSDGI